MDTPYDAIQAPGTYMNSGVTSFDNEIWHHAALREDAKFMQEHVVPIMFDGYCSEEQSPLDNLYDAEQVAGYIQEEKNKIIQLEKIPGSEAEIAKAKTKLLQYDVMLQMCKCQGEKECVSSAGVSRCQ